MPTRLTFAAWIDDLVQTKRTDAIVKAASGAMMVCSLRSQRDLGAERTVESMYPWIEVAPLWCHGDCGQKTN